MPAIVQKLRGVVHELGATAAFLYLADRALQPLGMGIYPYVLVAQPIPAEPLLPARRGQSIAVRAVSNDDPVLFQMPLDERVIKYREGQRAQCLGAFEGERMIGCIWLCLGPYDEDEIRCRYVPAPAGRTSFDFDFYIVPERRIGFAFARLWDEANRHLREHGVRYTMSRITRTNRQSLVSHTRLGARKIGSAIFFRFGPVQLMTATLAPYLYLSLGRGSRPELVLNAPGD